MKTYQYRYNRTCDCGHNEVSVVRPRKHFNRVECLKCHKETTYNDEDFSCLFKELIPYKKGF